MEAAEAAAKVNEQKANWKRMANGKERTPKSISQIYKAHKRINNHCGKVVRGGKGVTGRGHKGLAKKASAAL